MPRNLLWYIKVYHAVGKVLFTLTFLAFGAFIRTLISYEIENLGRAVYIDSNLKTQDDPIIKVLVPIISESSNARGNELSAFCLMGHLTSNLPPPKKFTRCIQMFSNALIRVIN
jgi:hypothetical protein